MPQGKDFSMFYLKARVSPVLDSVGYTHANSDIKTPTIVGCYTSYVKLKNPYSSPKKFRFERLSLQ